MSCYDTAGRAYSSDAAAHARINMAICSRVTACGCWHMWSAHFTAVFFSAGFEFQGQLDIDFWRADDALEEEEVVVVEGDLPGNKAFNASVYEWI